MPAPLQTVEPPLMQTLVTRRAAGRCRCAVTAAVACAKRTVPDNRCDR